MIKKINMMDMYFLWDSYLVFQDSCRKIHTFLAQKSFCERAENDLKDFTKTVVETAIDAGENFFSNLSACLCITMDDERTFDIDFINGMIVYTLLGTEAIFSPREFFFNSAQFSPKNEAMLRRILNG